MVGIGGSPIAIFRVYSRYPFQRLSASCSEVDRGAPLQIAHPAFGHGERSDCVWGARADIGDFKTGDPRDVMYALQMGAIWLCTGALTG